MVTEKNERVEFIIDSEDLIKSIALLEDMRDFCKEQEEISEGKKETTDALTVAVETMQAFWLEHFSEEEADDS